MLILRIIQAMFEILYMGRFVVIPLILILVLACVIAIIRHPYSRKICNHSRLCGSRSSIFNDYDTDYIEYWMQYGGYLTEEQFRKATDIHG